MFYGLLLAGGKSSRMGQDKRLLKIEGQSLLKRAIDLLEQSSASRILISGDVDEHDCIPDLLPDCGPLGGLHAVLHFLDNESGLDGSPLLVIPVDMPMLDSNTLTALLDSIGESEACQYENEIFPCVFRMTSNLKDHLDGLFAEGKELGGKRSMKALLVAFSAYSVSTEKISDQTFKNMNHPDDWEPIRK
ncbi:MAG: molybdenum cofactor guanylyltransferase [Gammaproteobacteria bacterium]|nr:molybdenum cofactor guanylyltransferase [Gammaproteobacteria bacterium]